MQKLKTKEFWVAVFAFLIGVVGIALIVMQVCYVGSYEAEYISQEEAYTVDTVPNGYAYLTYYTNITLLLFCIYAVVKFVAVLFNLEKLKKLLNNRYLLLFLALNELIVLVVYTAMMFVFNFSMFKYEPTPHNMHDFGSSMFKHFFVTIFAVVYCFCILKKEPKRVEMKKCLWFALYPLCYFIMAQIVGRTCYKYYWFPYPFFATEQIWLTFFGTLKTFNFKKAMLLLLACDVVILAMYFLAMLFCIFICRKLQKNDRKNTIKGVIYAKTEK